MWMYPFLAVALLLLLAGGALIWLLADRRRLAARGDELARACEEAERQNASLRDENAGFRQDIAVAQETQKHVQKQFESAQQQLRDAFKALAGDALKQSTEQFITLAKKAFENEQKDAVAALDQRKTEVDALIKPIRKALKHYGKAVQEMEKERKGAYDVLREQVASMQLSERQLAEETRKLVAALRRPEVRGRWGEATLRRVVELAGMVDRCDFTEQIHVKGSDGDLKPDLVVHLPSRRDVVVDAKATLDAYLQALEADTPAVRQSMLKKHVAQIEEQVGKLSSKKYQQQFERSPDFVVLFIPGESFLHAAVDVKPQLLDWAWDRDVMIATPSTLITLLKAVAVGWREEDVAANAREIQELAIELHRRLGTALEHLQRLGGALDTSVRHYNSFVGSFESNVVTQARKFEQLSVRSAKELVDIDIIERTSRSMKKADDLKQLSDGSDEPAASSSNED